MVDERISEEEKGELTKDISKEEIKAALIQMNPLKATGLDGFNVFFFQRYWDVVENEVCNCVFNFFQERRNAEHSQSHQHRPHSKDERPFHAYGLQAYQLMQRGL